MVEWSNNTFAPPGFLEWAHHEIEMSSGVAEDVQSDCPLVLLQLLMLFYNHDRISQDKLWSLG